jgi:hypothetical protein
MTEHEHMPPIVRDGAKRLTAGKILVTIRGAEHVIPVEEAVELWSSICDAIAGPGPKVVCEVVR